MKKPGPLCCGPDCGFLGYWLRLRARGFWRYELQVQSQPSAQLSQQSCVQPQSGQPSQQSLWQQLAVLPNTAAGEAAPNAKALAKRVPTMANE